MAYRTIRHAQDMPVSVMQWRGYRGNIAYLMGLHRRTVWSLLKPGDNYITTGKRTVYHRPHPDIMPGDRLLTYVVADITTTGVALSVDYAGQTLGSWTPTSTGMQVFSASYTMQAPPQGGVLWTIDGGGNKVYAVLVIASQDVSLPDAPAYPGAATTYYWDHIMGQADRVWEHYLGTSYLDGAAFPSSDTSVYIRAPGHDSKGTSGVQAYQCTHEVEIKSDGLARNIYATGKDPDLAGSARTANAVQIYGNVTGQGVVSPVHPATGSVQEDLYMGGDGDDTVVVMSYSCTMSGTYASDRAPSLSSDYITAGDLNALSDYLDGMITMHGASFLSVFPEGVAVADGVSQVVGYGIMPAGPYDHTIHGADGKLWVHILMDASSALTLQVSITTPSGTVSSSVLAGSAGIQMARVPLTLPSVTDPGVYYRISVTPSGGDIVLHSATYGIGG